MNLYLVRHARQSSRLCNVNVELGQEGFQMAELLSERMKHVPLDTIYSSDLIRAVQTAEIINKHHGLNHVIRAGLQEIDFGDWTGLEDSVIRETYQEFIQNNAKMEEDLPYPGGENGADVIRRAMPVIQEIIESGQENVLVVTHGGVIRALTAHLLGMEQAQKGLFGTALEHSSITQFVYNEKTKRFYLQRFNDHAHLEGHPELMRNSWKV